MLPSPYSPHRCLCGNLISVSLARARRVAADDGHPYTQALLASVLTPEPGLGVPDIGLGLAFPDPLNPPPGCALHPRCPQRMDHCNRVVPALVQQPGEAVACHLHPAEQARAT